MSEHFLRPVRVVKVRGHEVAQAVGGKMSNPRPRAEVEFRRGRAVKTVLVGAVVGEGLEQHGRAVELVEHDRDGLRFLRLEVGRHDRLGCDQRPALVGLEGDLASRAARFSSASRSMARMMQSSG